HHVRDELRRQDRHPWIGPADGHGGRDREVEVAAGDLQALPVEAEAQAGEDGRRAPPRADRPGSRGQRGQELVALACELHRGTPSVTGERDLSLRGGRGCGLWTRAHRTRWGTDPRPPAVHSGPQPGGDAGGRLWTAPWSSTGRRRLSTARSLTLPHS